MTRHLIVTVIALCFGAMCVGACGASLPDYDYSAEPNPKKMEYVLGVSDSININIWEQGNLSTRASIRPDGTITMPLIGDLKAEGKTPTELEKMIRKKLANYLQEIPEITIAVDQWASYRFTVSGEVNAPGIIDSARYLRIDEAIATAGGLTRFAKKNEMVLIRTDPKTGDIRRIPLAYDPIVNGKRPDMNLWLLRGDTLHVP